jgi:hypothetical protein
LLATETALIRLAATSAAMAFIWAGNSTCAIHAGSGKTHYGSAISGYFIDDDLVGDAAQRSLLLS